MTDHEFTDEIMAAFRTTTSRMIDDTLQHIIEAIDNRVRFRSVEGISSEALFAYADCITMIKAVAALYETQEEPEMDKIQMNIAGTVKVTATSEDTDETVNDANRQRTTQTVINNGPVGQIINIPADGHFDFSIFTRKK